MQAAYFRSERRVSIGLALGAAALFGLSTPAAKTLLAVTDPWLLAGLLYLGSGVSLGLFRLVRRALARAPATEAPLPREQWIWLGAAIVSGGAVGPVLLMFGLSWGSAADTALLLNLEGVFTAVLAWVVFREPGAMAVAWQPSERLRLSGAALLDRLDRARFAGVLGLRLGPGSSVTGRNSGQSKSSVRRALTRASARCAGASA